MSQSAELSKGIWLLRHRAEKAKAGGSKSICYLKGGNPKTNNNKQTRVGFGGYICDRCSEKAEAGGTPKVLGQSSLYLETPNTMRASLPPHPKKGDRWTMKRHPGTSQGGAMDSHPFVLVLRELSQGLCTGQASILLPSYTL